MDAGVNVSHKGDSFGQAVDMRQVLGFCPASGGSVYVTVLV